MHGDGGGGGGVVVMALSAYNHHIKISFRHKREYDFGQKSGSPQIYSCWRKGPPGVSRTILSLLGNLS